MITVQNAGNVFIGVPGSAIEFGITNAGTWSFSAISYVSGGTNAAVYFGGTNITLRDGATILVDSGGLVEVVQAPDYWGAASMGFATAVAAIGPILLLRFTVGRFMAWARIPGSGGA